MTTICYRAGVLAGDTRVVTDDGEIHSGDSRKVFRLKNGALVGFAGTMARWQPILRELRKCPERITVAQAKGDEVAALYIDKDGNVLELDKAGWTERKAKYYAIGTGSTPASVAMRLGFDARAAVKLAMEFDSHTGGKVQAVKLGTPSRK